MKYKESKTGAYYMERFLYKEEMPGIVIDCLERGAKFSMPIKHFHEEYEIYYLLQGQRYYFIDGKTYDIQAGNLVFVNKNQIHQTSQSSSAGHTRILIELHEQPFKQFLSLTNEISLESFFAAHQGVVVLDDAGQKEIETLLRNIQTELHNKKTGYQTNTMANLANLFFSIERITTASSQLQSLPLSTETRHRKVDDVADFIAKEYAQPLSLESIATHFYLNKCYLSRVFKQVTGFTINEYINVIRIRQAKKYLMESEYSITEISDFLGYTNITYFERVFRNYVEVSPLQFRKQYDQAQFLKQ